METQRSDLPWGAWLNNNPAAAGLDPSWHLQRPHVPWLLPPVTEHGCPSGDPFLRGRTPLRLA